MGCIYLLNANIKWKFNSNVYSLKSIRPTAGEDESGDYDELHQPPTDVWNARKIMVHLYTGDELGGLTMRAYN
jgi:hypothetical protein